MDGHFTQNAAQATTAQIEQDSKTVYAYHKMNLLIDKPADAIFCLCSLDIRVADYATQLFIDGYGRYAMV